MLSEMGRRRVGLDEWWLKQTAPIGAVWMRKVQGRMLETVFTVGCALIFSVAAFTSDTS